MTTALDSPLLATAHGYATAGIAVFPVRVQVIGGRKKLAPITAWDKVSTNDPTTIDIWFGPRGIWRDASLAIDCGKSELVVVDPDGAEGIANWDALVTQHRIAATWRAATPGGGQHWIFRADPNQPVGNSASKIAPRIDVRGVGGFIIAPPSVDDRGRYHWLEGEPEWDQLPIVPHLVIEKATAPRVANNGHRPANGYAHTNGHRRFTQDQAVAFCKPQVEALRNAVDGTINQTLNNAAITLGHFVPDGFWSRAQAEAVLLEALRPTAYDAKTWLAENTITSGLEAGIADWRATKVAPRPTSDEVPLPPDPDEPGEPPSPTDRQAPEPEPTSSTTTLPGLPDHFWDSRTVLAHIRQAARARVQIPDVVFYAVLARLAAIRDYRIKADSGISTPAALNLYVGIVGYSGDGKTQGVKVAAELLPAPVGLDFEGALPLGSGEGMAEAYQGLVELPAVGRKKPKEVKTQVRHNALFFVDEGQTLIKLLFERNGGTTGAALRSAWGGEMIGQRNAQEVTTRIVREGSYSLGLIVGFQPSMVALLLADGGTGMPQRFCWSTAHDPNIPDDRAEWPGSLPWDPDIITRPTTIEFPDAVQDQIYRDNIARKRGEVQLHELDGQKPLMLVKLAALLALLDSRTEVNGEDWELAELVWDTSCSVRDTLVTLAGEQRSREQTARDDMYVSRAVRTASAVTSTEKAVIRVARVVALAVHESDGLTHGAAFRALAGRDRKRGRPFYDDACEYAAGQGWVALGEHGMNPGQSRPAVT